MPTVREIAAVIESFAPLRLQEDYDNAGLQIGDPSMQCTSVLICLDVTEEVVAEAVARGCNLIVSHHPLLFKGLKSVTGKSPVERIVAETIRRGIAVYSAHTNLDSAREGVSYEIAHTLGLRNLEVLESNPGEEGTGLGVVGDIDAIPKMEFLRKVKKTFGVRGLRYSAQTSRLVVRRVAVCGGAGASLIGRAAAVGADTYVTADLKYHDFTTWGPDLLLADIGHYESELCAEKILARIVREKYPELTIYFPESEDNPVNCL